MTGNRPGGSREDICAPERTAKLKMVRMEGVAHALGNRTISTCRIGTGVPKEVSSSWSIGLIVLAFYAKSKIR
jgi:hypothetical protein